MRLDVITEGVETFEQYQFLERHGCDYAQGYLLSRPVPLAELRPVLNEINQRKHACTVTPLSLVHGRSALM
ncbi:putative cyclic-di-GMP phosphodiesterase AdrB [compost metagenome]